MARATFVKAARKDYPSAGIKKGESYWWWKFRFGSKHMSKTRPTRSQLTQSEFYGQVYDIQDEIAALGADADLPGNVEDIASRVREIGEECSSRRDNMPEALQDSETGELLQERADNMENAASELESIDFNDAPEEDEPEQQEGESDEDFEARVQALEAEHTEYWERKLEEVQAVSIDA